MKISCSKILPLFALTVLSATLSLPASETNSSLPLELQTFLRNADDFVLFSIESVPDFERKSTNTFQNHVILGQLEVKSVATREKLIAALDKGIGEESASVPPDVTINLPDCFNPRHGIRARKGDETVELLICFECNQIYVTSHSATNQLFMTTGKPAATFNKVLKDAGVPLPTD